jgi:hypothetical protein
MTKVSTSLLKSSATLSGCISVFRSVFGTVEELLAQRGIVVTYETVRQWRLGRPTPMHCVVVVATNGLWTRSCLGNGSLLVARDHLDDHLTPGLKTHRQFHISSLKKDGDRHLLVNQPSNHIRLKSLLPLLFQRTACSYASQRGEKAHVKGLDGIIVFCARDMRTDQGGRFYVRQCVPKNQQLHVKISSE